MNEPHEMYFCRICQAASHLEEALALACELADSLKAGECVPEAEYRRRLEICARCPRLRDGHTCGVCGCFVIVRARRREMACPDVGGERW